MTGRERLRAALGAGVDVVGESAGRHGLSLGVGARTWCTPMAEGTSVGIAAGLALAGRRVVVELVDPEGPRRAAEALRELAELLRQGEGGFAARLVVLAPVGPKVEGIDTLVAASADELPGALLTALDAGRPLILQVTAAALDGREEPAEALPVGRARLRRAGSGITLLAEGEGVALALAQPVGEVLDLRGGVDRAAIAASVRRTGRVLLVHEGGSAALDVALHEAFLHLESPPATVHAAAGAEALGRAIHDCLSY